MWCCGVTLICGIVQSECKNPFSNAISLRNKILDRTGTWRNSLIFCRYRHIMAEIGFVQTSGKLESYMVTVMQFVLHLPVVKIIQQKSKLSTTHIFILILNIKKHASTSSEEPIPLIRSKVRLHISLLTEPSCS